MKQFFVITLLLFFNTILNAQPLEVSQRGFYSVQQVMQARENAEMNRHYESMKPVSTPSKWGTINAGADIKLPYGGDDFRQSQIAAGKRLEAQEAAWKAKVDKLRRLIVDRKIGKEFSDYNTFMAAVNEVFDNYNYISRVFPTTASQYEVNAKNTKSAFFKEWFYYENLKIEEVEKAAEEKARKERYKQEELKMQEAIRLDNMRRKEINDAKWDKYLSTLTNYRSKIEAPTSTTTEKLNAVISMIRTVKDLNSEMLWNSNKKIAYHHLYYQQALLQMQLGIYDGVSDLLYDMMKNKTSEDFLPSTEKVYQKIMYAEILRGAHSWVASSKQFYEKLLKQKLNLMEFPYASYLNGNINDAIENIESFSKTDASNKTKYNYLKAALLLVAKEEKEAVKFSNKNLGAFADVENLKLVVVDTLWSYVINNTPIENIVPIEVFFCCDILKRIEPKSLAIAELSLKYKNAAIWHKAAIEDNELVKSLGGDDNLNASTTKKITDETNARNKKIAEQNKKQEELSKIQFIDPTISSYMFTNWQTATEKVKWKQIDINGNGTKVNVVDNKLAFNQNTSTYILGDYKIPENKDWAFSVEITTENCKEYARQGIILKTKGQNNETKEGKRNEGKEFALKVNLVQNFYNVQYSYLYKGDYPDGVSEPSDYEARCKWESLENSNATNSFANSKTSPTQPILYCEAGSVTNVYSIKKIKDFLWVYINYKLIYKMKIYEEQGYLNEIKQIGIVLTGEQKGSINNIAFIEESNNGIDEGDLDGMWDELDPNAPKKNTVADFEKDILYLLNFVKNTDLQSLRGGVDVDTKTFTCGVEKNYPDPHIYGLKPNGSTKYLTQCIDYLKKMLNERVEKNKWKVSINEYVHTKSDKKQNGYGCSKWIYLTAYDENGKGRLGLKYCDNPQDDHYGLRIFKK